MSGTILDKIFEAKRLRVEEAKRRVDLGAVKELAFRQREAKENNRLRSAMGNKSQINVIAEFKKASPSKGVINESVDAASVAREYAAGGAAAISVLTEQDFFKGSLDDLRAVSSAADISILRKDFVFDSYQIYEAAEAGADAILLIAAMLPDDKLSELHTVAESELGLDALVEVHTVEELETVKGMGAILVGVNNRDLRSFEVSLDVSRNLIGQAAADMLMIAESGLRTRDDILELSQLGFSGFLIGETLMRSDDREAELKGWTRGRAVRP